MKTLLIDVLIKVSDDEKFCSITCEYFDNNFCVLHSIQLVNKERSLTCLTSKCLKSYK